MSDGIVLGPNQYGKAECHLVRVDRDTDGVAGRHRITDLTVTSQLRGDFTDCHLTGDNSAVVATDTQKNTIHAFARSVGIGSAEDFLLRLGEHFVGSHPQVTGGRWAADVHGWGRIGVDGPDGRRDHDHAFVRSGTETRRALVHSGAGRTSVVSGLTDCTVMKSTGSEFSGFPRDRYTTLAETDDRILATSLTAWWRHRAADGVDWDASYAAVREVLLSTFAQTHSLALQQTVFAMGRAVLQARPEVAEIRLSCPNKHHFPVDLAPFGLDNPGEVFHAADRPYGLIEAAVQREDEPEATEVWASVAGFV